VEQLCDNIFIFPFICVVLHMVLMFKLLHIHVWLFYSTDLVFWHYFSLLCQFSKIPNVNLWHFGFVKQVFYRPDSVPVARPVASKH